MCTTMLYAQLSTLSPVPVQLESECIDWLNWISIAEQKKKKKTTRQRRTDKSYMTMTMDMIQFNWFIFYEELQSMWRIIDRPSDATAVYLLFLYTSIRSPTNLLTE